MKAIKNSLPIFTFLLAFGFFHVETKAQNSVVLSSQDPNRRVIITAVPFLNFAPDSRHSAMGDVGVATSPDANSAHWNAGKLAFIEDDMGFSLSYSPWLGRLVPDMSLNYLTGYKKIDDVSAFGIDLRYFNMGDIALTDGQGNSLGDFSPRDIAIGGTYSRKLSDNLSLGISARFIHSNLSGNISASGGNESRPGVSVGTDVGLYHTSEILISDKEGVLSWGINLSNIGPKITYNSADDLDYLPTNFRIGSALTIPMDELNKITFALDLNKLMVPSPPIYMEDENGQLVIDPNTGNPQIEAGKDPTRPLISGMFGSFVDAPDGFSEELQELMISFGTEYSYDDKFALRLGYFYENASKGGRRYFTMGVGFKYNRLGFDFSYLVPQVQNHPLAETLRFSLQYNVQK
ncbi:type IX secretion system outer membrane channel protein PorV [Cyclobacterium sp. 1_MG-2023]|uniref:type IX secretion system outer membrane channel protein PorV n=1 Tax=Cyclobacterium sp. 1_MG-2023 TaxID=3062681 RepID=UPI0026E1F0CE|nr:type IX secretion system outer membrane channel protein PorV [Cyclobacterium sp. 1_MG-2023]MDO6436426.1 type IX secretion system outer membrane channel protein PorV [Cyclobacterium sp. 1_MG-2023]